jgi:hypothetical protein
MSPFPRAMFAGALIAAAIVAAALYGVSPLAVRSAPAVPLSLSAHYEHAVAFDAFVADEREHGARWRELYVGSTPAVEAVLPRIAALPGRWHLLVVAEAWCSDATNSVPHLARLAALADNVEMRLLRKREAASLLEAYTLNGESRIPLVVVMDEHHGERAVWIERPQVLHALVAEWRADPRGNPGAEVRAWYENDEGRTALDEIATLLERAAAGGVVPMQVAGEPEVRQCGVD